MSRRRLVVAYITIGIVVMLLVLFVGATKSRYDLGAVAMMAVAAGIFWPIFVLYYVAYYAADLMREVGPSLGIWLSPSRYLVSA